MLITIKKIQHENKVGQSGKSYESCRILTTNSQGQDVWVSGFGSQTTHTWENGDSIDVDLEQRGQYWNFKENGNTKPSPDKKLALLEKIDRKLDLLLSRGVNGQVSSENASNGQIEASQEITAEDLPF